MIGNLTGFVASQNWFPQPGDVSGRRPIGPDRRADGRAAADAVLRLSDSRPARRFSPERALEVMRRYGVTNSFLFRPR